MLRGVDKGLSSKRTAKKSSKPNRTITPNPNLDIYHLHIRNFRNALHTLTHEHSLHRHYANTNFSCALYGGRGGVEVPVPAVSPNVSM